MALTVTLPRDGSGLVGNLRWVRGTIDFDSSYPTGGESLTAANLGLRTIDLLLVQPQTGLVFEYDYTNAALLAYVQGVAIAAAGAATIDDFALTGVGASTARSIGLDASATTPVLFGGLKQVANTTDLSTITGVRFLAFGV